MRRTLVILFASVLLAMAPDANAGYRCLYNKQYSPGEAVFSYRFIDSLSLLRVHGHGTGGGGTVKLSTSGFSLTQTFPADGSTTTVEFNMMALLGAGVKTWALSCETQAVYVEWIEVVDIYGDPSYDHMQTGAAALSSGEIWVLDRSFSFDGVLLSVTLACLVLVSLIGLLFGRR